MKLINTLTKISLTAIALVSVLTPAAQAASLTFLAGKSDNFDTSDGTELTESSAGLILWRDLMYNPGGIRGSQDYTADFDGKETNQVFTNTFALPLSEKIQSAQLEFRLRALGDYSENDAVGIIFADNAGIQDPSASGWWRIGTEPGVSAPVLSDTLWTIGSTKTFTVNLADNLINAMNQKGFLDIFVQDDTAVDYITLKVETVPEPTTSLGLLGLGLLGASQILHKKGKKL